MLDHEPQKEQHLLQAPSYDEYPGYQKETETEDEA